MIRYSLQEFAVLPLSGDKAMAILARESEPEG